MALEGKKGELSLMDMRIEKENIKGDVITWFRPVRQGAWE